MSKRKSSTLLQAQERPQLTPEAKDAVIVAMAKKALQGNTAAAKIVLEEYHAKHGTDSDNALLRSLYELETRDRDNNSSTTANYH